MLYATSQKSRDFASANGWNNSTFNSLRLTYEFSEDLMVFMNSTVIFRLRKF